MSDFEFSGGSSSTDAQRGLFIPTKIASSGLMSQTSEASDCFVNQQFSNKLQAYMVNYVITISGIYSVYA